MASATLGDLLGRLDKIPIMSLLLFVTMTAFIVILAYLQYKRDALDLRWLLLDDKSGRPSIHKIGQLLALMVSTWGFVYQMTHNTFTETYLTVYMGVWAGVGAVNKLLDNKQPAGTTTYESTSTTVTATDATTNTDVVSVDIQPQGPK